MKSNLVAKLKRCNDGLKGESYSVYTSFLEKLLASNPSEITADLLESLRKGDWEGLIQKADSYSSAVYWTARDHFLANQFCSVIRKYPFPKGLLKIDPRKKATETFLKSEHKCKRINQRFAAYDKVRSPNEYSLKLARSWIRHVIGDKPPIAKIGQYCRFGPGASIGVHGSSTSMGSKMLAERWTVTPGAFYLARAVMKDDIHFMELLAPKRGCFFCLDPDAFDIAFGEKAELVINNKITFVPKTVMTERTIAVEPLLNGYLQLGVDALMKQFLKRVGIDLLDQSTNQRKAREGSFDDVDGWVTIDLSSASDSVSTALCRNLLPPEWFELLNSLRSPSYSLDGVIYPFEKFATMGNGFCFPLETLLFCSFCYASGQRLIPGQDFFVYGDDIIVRKSIADETLRLLKVCGFTPNSRKTFLTGPFRESCGTDWFSGEDVRPITLDFCFDSIQNIIKFCNLLKSKRIWEDVFYEARQYLVSLIPKDLLFTRPYFGQVDGALEVPLDEFMSSPFARWNAEMQSWSWKEIMSIPLTDKSVEEVEGYNLAVIRGALIGLKSDKRPFVACTGPNPFTLRRETRTKIRRMAYSGAVSNWVPAQGSEMVPWISTPFSYPLSR